MANAAANAAQKLPRFLLPRLSWQTVAVSTPLQAVQGLSTSSPNFTNTPWPTQSTTSNALIRTRREAPRSKTSILHNPSLHRAFHATARQARDHHFDTLKFVQRLQEEGFTEAQSVAMMKVLSDVIEERLLCPSSLSIASF
jgi:hypothetical protein